MTYVRIAGRLEIYYIITNRNGKGKKEAGNQRRDIIGLPDAAIRNGYRNRKRN